MSVLPTHWYYNTQSGQLTQGNNLENLGNNLLGFGFTTFGWHELDVPGNATEAQAAAAAEKEFPNGATPTTAGITPQRIAAVAAGEAGVPSVGTLIGDLTQRNFWLRVAKAVAGIALIIIGISHITGAGKAARDIAKTVL